MKLAIYIYEDYKYDGFYLRLMHETLFGYSLASYSLASSV